ncbi:helix-hairpin-helix domain-containing protein [Marinomonas algarum]|uniref:Helix-hairpin-helix domain-containing protein n=1 Tax=Marinomonas algarum TaxID=2883105 RepID=A0A9X1IMV9_9GAMM|nr:helix-hairpin-helix domain-containing protein [Marinomonas algarum]MCB5161734.1 helix-hairpin-helix domain-containing protein [Marinomonas algarum]
MNADNLDAGATALTLQGCAYRIEHDRVVLSIQCISNHRNSGNISGTLRLQLCAYPKGSEHEAEPMVLASTTLGELSGQHVINNGLYDLLFQSPPAGLWQLVLQLSEWDGMDYISCDDAYFPVLYHVTAENAHSPDTTAKKETSPDVKKNATGCSDGYLAINQCKVKALLKVKGIPKKVLEKLIKERPFPSERAVLNVKGVGPVKLKRIIDQLTNQ